MAEQEEGGAGLERVCDLPNGLSLYREPNEAGGHRYWSDECGGGVVVWDTCLVGQSTLLAAIVEEERRLTAERHAAATLAAPGAEPGRGGEREGSRG